MICRDPSGEPNVLRLNEEYVIEYILRTSPISSICKLVRIPGLWMSSRFDAILLTSEQVKVYENELEMMT